MPTDVTHNTVLLFCNTGALLHFTLCCVVSVLQGDPRWVIADPICTFVFAFLVLLTTKNIIKDIIHTLMERTPVQHDIVEMLAALHEVKAWRRGQYRRTRVVRLQQEAEVHSCNQEEQK